MAMPAFRRVDAQRAGPTALGILVPPGGKTLVILRPRGLEWDLLPARWGEDARVAPVFCQFERDEAALVARRLHQCLEGLVLVGTNPVETFGNPLGQHFQVWGAAGGMMSGSYAGGYLEYPTDPWYSPATRKRPAPAAASCPFSIPPPTPTRNIISTRRILPADAHHAL